MHANVPVDILSANVGSHTLENVPLQIIRSRIFMLPIWAERTHIARRLMHKTVSDHLILTLKALSALASWAAFHWAEMRPCLRVDVGVRAGQPISICTGCIQRNDLLQKVLRLKRGRRTSRFFTLVSTRKALWDVCKTGSNGRWQMPRCHRTIDAEHALPATFNWRLQHVCTMPNRAVVSFDRDRC